MYVKTAICRRGVQSPLSYQAAGRRAIPQVVVEAARFSVYWASGSSRVER